MKIIALSSSVSALPCLHFLKESGKLATIVCPNRNDGEVLDLRAWAQYQDIRTVCLSENELSSALSTLITTLKADLVVACTFPYKIPEDLLSVPSKGFINIHFSRLPQYKGPSPVFWQIKNGEKLTGITIHRMDKGWDSGKVLKTLEVPIYPGETTGICTARLSQLSVNLLKDVLESDLENTISATELASSYYQRPDVKDMRIDWNTDTATSIEQLVNACNPVGGGAVSRFRNQNLQVLEVSPVEGKGNPNVKGGTVVHADMNGLFVQCSDQNILRINIVKLNEGTITGFKFAALGVKAGDVFENYKQNLN